MSVYLLYFSLLCKLLDDTFKFFHFLLQFYYNFLADTSETIDYIIESAVIVNNNSLSRQ